MRYWENIEDADKKIPDIINLLKTDYDEKITEVESKIIAITDLAILLMLLMMLEIRHPMWSSKKNRLWYKNIRHWA